MVSFLLFAYISGAQSSDNLLGGGGDMGQSRRSDNDSISSGGSNPHNSEWPNRQCKSAVFVLRGLKLSGVTKKEKMLQCHKPGFYLLF